MDEVIVLVRIVLGQYDSRIIKKGALQVAVFGGSWRNRPIRPVYF